jgi:predicted membrane protein DUF2306
LSHREIVVFAIRRPEPRGSRRVSARAPWKGLNVTQSDEKIEVITDDRVRSLPERRAARRRIGSFWMVPLVMVVIAFLAYELPPYLKLDPKLARIPHLHVNVWWHYPALVAHIMFGTIALVTVRRKHPAVHRWSGRLYVFAGMLPTALLALLITPYSAGPPGNATAAILWIVVTFVGYAMVRKRRYADHRRWMTYSFAMATQIFWGRVELFLVLPLFPHFNPTDPNELNIALETATWIGFVINLLLAQIFLEWSSRRIRRAAVPSVGAADL